MPRSKVKFSSTDGRIDDRIRPKQAAIEAQCSVGMIHVWIKQGHFKSWTVTQRDKERGLRYIDAKSFRAFLASQMEEASK